MSELEPSASEAALDAESAFVESCEDGDAISFSCLEKEERTADFLEACAKLDAKRIHAYVSSATKAFVADDMVDSVGQNGLHFVAASAQSDECESSIVQMLAEPSLGLDVNAARSTDGWTPLFLAAVFGRSSLVSTLLALGADPKRVDKDGHTAEHWAAHYKMHAVRDILVHHRSKVPHSRFSCVRQPGPAATAKKSSTSSSASSCDSPPQDKEGTEASNAENVLLAAQ